MKKLTHILVIMLATLITFPVSARMQIFERNYKDGLLDGQRLAQITSNWDTVQRINRRSELQVAYTCSRLAKGLQQNERPYQRMLTLIYNQQDISVTKLDRRDDFYFAIGAAQSHMINGAAMRSASQGITTAQAMQEMSIQVYNNLCVPLLSIE